MNTTDENLQPAYMSVLNHVATVTINRPEAMNAIDPETSERLSGFWKEVRFFNHFFRFIIMVWFLV